MKQQKVDCVDSGREQHEINSLFKKRQELWMNLMQARFVCGKKIGMYEECQKEYKEEKAILLTEIQARKQGTQLELCSADFSSLGWHWYNCLLQRGLLQKPLCVFVSKGERL